MQHAEVMVQHMILDQVVFSEIKLLPQNHINKSRTAIQLKVHSEKHLANNNGTLGHFSN